MSRRAAFSALEKEIALYLQEEGKSIREIAKIMARSKTTIHKFLQNPQAYEAESRLGRKPVIDEKTKRKIRHLAISRSMTLDQIKAHLSLNVTKNRIHQILTTDNIFFENDESVSQSDSNLNYSSNDEFSSDNESEADIYPSSPTTSSSFDSNCDTIVDHSKLCAAQNNILKSIADGLEALEAQEARYFKMTEKRCKIKEKQGDKSLALLEDVFKVIKHHKENN